MSGKCLGMSGGRGGATFHDGRGRYKEGMHMDNEKTDQTNCRNKVNFPWLESKTREGKPRHGKKTG